MAAPLHPSLMFGRDRRVRRVTQLLAGLILYGVSMAMMVRANLGLDPWDVLTQGLAPRLGLSFGLTVNVIGLAVLLLWLPLRQRPGLGTIPNVVVIGTVTDVGLAWMSQPETYWARFALLGFGIVLNGIAGGAYIGAGLGAGPRDGLMTGFCGITGLPVRLVRTAIELSVVFVGWALGGSVGIGTVFYAISIGWIVHCALSVFALGGQLR